MPFFFRSHIFLFVCIFILHWHSIFLSLNSSYYCTMKFVRQIFWRLHIYPVSGIHPSTKKGNKLHIFYCDKCVQPSWMVDASKLNDKIIHAKNVRSSTRKNSFYRSKFSADKFDFNPLLILQHDELGEMYWMRPNETKKRIKLIKIDGLFCKVKYFIWLLTMCSLQMEWKHIWLMLCM